jgi:hypothetical protein
MEGSGIVDRFSISLADIKLAVGEVVCTRSWVVVYAGEMVASVTFDVFDLRLGRLNKDNNTWMDNVCTLENESKGSMVFA